jgi:hypothetical protein
VFLTSALAGVVSFTPRRKIPRYPLDRRQGGPQNRSGRRGEEKNLVPTGTRTLDPSAVQPLASRYTDCTIPNQDLILKTIRSLSYHSVAVWREHWRPRLRNTCTDEGCLPPSYGWSRCLQRSWWLPRQKHQPPPAASVTKQNEPTVLMPPPLRHIGSSSLRRRQHPKRGGANFHPKISCDCHTIVKLASTFITLSGSFRNVRTFKLWMLYMLQGGQRSTVRSHLLRGYVPEDIA